MLHPWHPNCLIISSTSGRSNSRGAKSGGWAGGDEPAVHGGGNGSLSPLQRQGRGVHRAASMRYEPPG
jgi:hypothetical protein